MTASPHLSPILALALAAALPAAPQTAPTPQAATAARGLTAVPFHRVTVDDPFWSPRIKATLERTLEACLHQCEITGRIQNFAIAAGIAEGEHRGALYNDSDVYKILQGAAYALSFRRDPGIEVRVDEIIDLIAGSQGEDGYVNTYYTLREPDKRWQNIAHGHELYCAGHLIEAGIAYHRATGKRQLLDVAIRFADYIDRVFGPGRRTDPPGHQEIELALIQLHRVTGEARYGKLARFFLEQRGRHQGRKSYGDYSQDHLPVRQQDRAVGHSVRAMYQTCALTDVARQDGDAVLRRTLERLWDDIYPGKIYVTGGIGAVAGIEGFAPSFVLPNDTAYAETCAAIAMVMWGHRMYLLTGESRYADGLERALYNGMLSGVSLRGDRFFYRNPLGSRGGRGRSAWFGCACCPSNVVRFVPAVGGMVYAQESDAIHVLLYVGSATRVELAGGAVGISQKGAYPWRGKVELRLAPERPMEFGLRLRIPAFCAAPPRVTVNGEKTAGEPEAGALWLRRTWRPGDVVGVEFPLPVRRVHDDPRVESNRGRVSLQRGPLVYCIEGIDHGGHSRNIAVPPDAELRAVTRPDLLGGVVTIEGEARRRTAGDAADDAGDGAEPVHLRAVPYYAWANRDRGEMVTWIPERLALAEVPGRGPTVRVGDRQLWASHCFGGDSVAAVADGKLPRNSDDHDIPRLTFWPRRGTTEYVSCRLDAPRTVGAAAVYWFDDEPRRGGCRRPASWRLLYRKGDELVPVELLAGQRYATDKDRAVRVRFTPVEAREFRLEVTLREGFSAGVLEWTLDR